MLNYEYHLGPRHTKNSTLKRGVRGNLDPQATFNIEEGARDQKFNIEEFTPTRRVI